MAGIVKNIAMLLPPVRRLKQSLERLSAERAGLHRRLAVLEQEMLRFADDAKPSPQENAGNGADAAPETWLPRPQPTAADGRRQMTFYIDIFSGCNLRCPSCPVSNKPEPGDPVPKGLMTGERLRRILDKATAECSVTSVGLFNWTEPLLNPEAARLVEIVKSYGLYCSISSNLNRMRNIEAVLDAGLDWLRISLSGFTQENYGETHRGGDIDVVKANMIELARIRQRTGAKVDIEVFFHRYLGNLDDEVKMRRFAEGLGFRFVAAWAQMMPVEKILGYVAPGSVDVALSAEDHAIIDRLALPLREAVALTARHPVSFCALQDDYMALDVDGSVYLCCAVSSRSGNRLASYLETPLAELQRQKQGHALCSACMRNGLPLYLEHRHPGFDALGRDRIRRHYDTAGIELAP